MLAKIQFKGEPIPFSDPNQRNLVAEVSCQSPKVVNPSGYPHVIAYDCGMKYNIIREFVKRGVKLTILPYNANIDDYAGTLLLMLCLLWYLKY